MKRRIDGRTIKGLRIREQVRERILIAYIALIRSGVPSPTARATAERAGLSLRVIFKHYADLRALGLAAISRLMAESDEFFSEEIPNRGTAAERLQRFVEQHLRQLEYLIPVRRSAAMVESIDPDVAAGMRQARTATARELARSLGPTLKRFSSSERSALLTTLHMVCSWESLQTLRAQYRLSAGRARTIITTAALPILGDAERRARAQCTSDRERRH